MKVVKALTYLVVVAVYAFVSGSLLLFHGPFGSVKDYVIGAFATSRHGYLLRPMSLYTLPESVIQKYSPNNTSGKGGTSSAAQANKDFTAQEADNNIQMETYQGSTFSANIMLISNPLRVKVAVTSKMGDVGESVSEMVADHNAIAGINGGSFKDVGWHGTGGVPLGITIVDGKVVQADSANGQPIIAITDKGALIAGTYTLQQLQELHVQQALSFMPVLVQDGKSVVQGSGGWGYAPRTAIGQRADGTIILMTTDGRFIHGPNNVGASLADIANLMIQYGAVVAANCDGGSSTTMVYKGQLVNQPTDILGERKVATSWIVTR